jgi:hypothetical protein
MFGECPKFRVRIIETTADVFLEMFIDVLAGHWIASRQGSWIINLLHHFRIVVTAKRAQ